MIMKCAIIYIVCFSVAAALTDEEVAAFTSSVSITTNVRNGIHVISSDGTPDHATGFFPNDCNPNEIQEQSYQYRLPVAPTVASTPGDLNKGITGYAVNGVAFFNPCTSGNNDAVLNEQFDDCGGHPDGNGRYHYHGMPKCLFDDLQSDYKDTSEVFLGVALDGFPIYGPTDQPLDGNGCNGRFVGEAKTQWRYHISEDTFPYLMGCYVGEVSVVGDGIDTCDTGNLGGRCSADTGGTDEEGDDGEMDEGNDGESSNPPPKPPARRPRPRTLAELLMEILKRDELIDYTD